MISSLEKHFHEETADLDRTAAQWRDLRASWGQGHSGKNHHFQLLAFMQFNRLCKRDRCMLFTFLQTYADSTPPPLRCSARARCGESERPALQVPCERVQGKRNLACLRALQRITP